MSFSCVLLQVLLACLCLHEVASMSAMEYAEKVNTEMDREFKPIGGSKCKTSRFNKLKWCKLYLYDRKRLLYESSRYLTKSANYWAGDRSLSIEKPYGSRTEDTVSYYRRHHQSRARSPSADTYYRGGSSSSSGGRSKRAASKKSENPCAHKKAQKVIVLHGIDAITDQVVELLHDPDRHMFQTFFTFRCKRKSYYNMRCEIQYLVYVTAVFLPNSYKVAVRPVRIPCNCALAF